ncbi:hypothetical protein GCM10028775_24380 [Catellatospora paridis]
MGVVGDADESTERHNLDDLAYQDVTGVEFFEAGHAITSFLGRLRFRGRRRKEGGPRARRAITAQPDASSDHGTGPTRQSQRMTLAALPSPGNRVARFP